MINPRPKKSQESDFYFPKKLIRKKKKQFPSCDSFEEFEFSQMKGPHS